MLPKDLHEWRPNNAPAQYNLGQMYYNGNHYSSAFFSQDDKEAVKWYTKAARDLWEYVGPQATSPNGQMG